VILVKHHTKFICHRSWDEITKLIKKFFKPRMSVDKMLHALGTALKSQWSLCFFQFTIHSFMDFGQFGEYYMKFLKNFLNLIRTQLSILIRIYTMLSKEQIGYLTFIGVSRKVLPNFMRKIKGNWRTSLVLSFIANEGHEEYFTLLGQILSQKWIKSWMFLVFIQLKFMIFIKMRLPQNFIRHWPKVVGESCHNLWIFVVL